MNAIETGSIPVAFLITNATAIALVHVASPVYRTHHMIEIVRRHRREHSRNGIVALGVQAPVDARTHVVPPGERTTGLHCTTQQQVQTLR